MHTVVSTPMFLAQARRAGVSEKEIEEIELFLSENPRAGDVIRGAGGLRKVRFRRRGGGKRGGYRTIHFHGGDDIPIFLFALIDKAAADDLSQSAKNEFRRRLPQMVNDYRASTGKGIRSLGG